MTIIKSTDAGICCGKPMAKHIIKEGARYHVTSWDCETNGSLEHCSEPNCENNHGIGKCAPRNEDSPKMRGPPYWNDY
ncbi:MAG: hypothetical protein WCX79_00310 [Candidatus Paceibacterota bacterium]|jgi:hypothetical protein